MQNIQLLVTTSFASALSADVIVYCLPMNPHSELQVVRPRFFFHHKRASSGSHQYIQLTYQNPFSQQPQQYH